MGAGLSLALRPIRWICSNLCYNAITERVNSNRSGQMVLHLTGPQKRELHTALLDAFPDESDLRHMVRWELDENLRTIATGSSLKDVVFDLIEWADKEGKQAQLIAGAQNSNANNPILRA